MIDSHSLQFLFTFLLVSTRPFLRSLIHIAYLSENLRVSCSFIYLQREKTTVFYVFFFSYVNNVLNFFFLWFVRNVRLIKSSPNVTSARCTYNSHFFSEPKMNYFSSIQRESEPQSMISLSDFPGNVSYSNHSNHSNHYAADVHSSPPHRNI